MAATVKCQWCHTPVVTAAKVEYKGRNYHVKCHQAILKRDEFLDYVCEKQFLISPGPTIFAQRKSFIKKYGYTDEEMLMAAKYIHEVIQKDKFVEEWQGSIGLIPSVMERAKAHWAEQEQKQKRLEKITKEVLESPPQTVVIKASMPVEKPKNFIDPLSILEGED